MIEKQRLRSKDGFGSVLGLYRASCGGSWGSLGGALGPLDRLERASKFVLEPSWASLARFLLPKMALGAFWGCLWLVLGAPEGLFGGVLASDKPISTIKTAFPSSGNPDHRHGCQNRPSDATRSSRSSKFSCEHELANQRLRAGSSATAGAAPMWIRLVRRRTESQ